MTPTDTQALREQSELLTSEQVERACREIEYLRARREEDDQRIERAEYATRLAARRCQMLEAEVEHYARKRS